MTMTKSTVRRKGFIAVTGKNKADIEANQGRSSHLVCFLMQPVATCVGMVPLTVGETLLVKVGKSKFLTAISTGQSYLGNSSVKSFLSADSRLCQGGDEC